MSALGARGRRRGGGARTGLPGRLPPARRWQVDGICLAVDRGADSLPVAIDDIPVLGTDETVLSVAEQHNFEAVALLPSGRWPHARTRKLSWDLEKIGAELLIAPVLMDVVGPRLHISPLEGLPLLQMSAPSYSGPAWIVKNVFDRSSRC